jgi:hypothetical protein
MRMTISITTRIRFPEHMERVPRTDSRESFWRAVLRESEDAETGDERIRLIESRLKSRFPSSLETSLNRHIMRVIPDTIVGVGGVTMILKGITYNSLSMTLDAITSSLAIFGLTSDDLLDLVSRYTPDAFTEATEVSRPLDFHVTGRVTQEDPPPAVASPVIPTPQQASTPPGNSRLDRILNLANTSLVVTSAILLIGAFFLFQSAGQERARLTDAVIQERTEIAAQRAKLLDLYADQLKGFRDFLGDQVKHYGDLDQIEATLLNDRLNQLKTQSQK